MKNHIKKIATQEIELIKKLCSHNNRLYLAEMDGKKINKLDGYISEMNLLFKFQIPSRTLNGHLDWMKDLEWLNKDGYIFIINNYSQFMKDNPMDKQLVYEIFYEDILPFWDDEVERVTHPH